MKHRPAVHVVAALALAACAGDRQTPTEPESFTLPVFDRGGVPGHDAEQFRAAGLKGRNEAAPNDSKGTGAATFTLAPDGQSIDYRLILANIEGVTQSHIHLAPAGVNGPIVVFLFGFVPEGVSPNGLLAEGTFTAANLIGPLAGHPLSDLVDALRSGGAYVNAHTLAIPSGEIRAQVH